MRRIVAVAVILIAAIVVIVAELGTRSERENALQEGTIGLTERTELEAPRSAGRGPASTDGVYRDDTAEDAPRVSASTDRQDATVSRPTRPVASGTGTRSSGRSKSTAQGSAGGGQPAAKTAASGADSMSDRSRSVESASAVEDTAAAADTTRGDGWVRIPGTRIGLWPKP